MAAGPVKVTWQEGIHFEGVDADKHVVHMDGRKDAGGQGLGFSPMQLLLAGLGGCTGMDVISVLKKMRQDVTGLEIELSGTRAPEHPMVYTDIDLIYHVRGHNLERESVEKAVRLSEEKYCSAEAMLRKAATITSRIEIIEEKP